MQPKQYINRLKNQWIAIYLVQGLAIGTGISLLIGSLYNYFIAEGFAIYLIVWLIATIAFCWYRKIWLIDSKYVLRYLDANFPELEDSSWLLLKPSNELGLLESLQISKIEKLIPQKKITGLGKIIWIGIISLAFGVLSFLVISDFAAKTDNLTHAEELLTTPSTVQENILPQVSEYAITIAPPAYTKNSTRKQKQLYIKAETEANVKWELETNIEVKSFYIIFNDKEKIKLQPDSKNGKVWTYTRKVTQQGFYQLELDGQKSDLYQIDLIPDLPVNIQITRPKPQTVIDFGQPKTVKILATLKDDYGVSDAFITATLASGKGESVSFTEKKLSFGAAFNGQKNQSLSKQIDLTQFGAKPGDEVYFYINARDNKGQQSRSDVYFISLVDTAELMSMAGMTSGVNLVPEYFRSERQIIIDTEKLLAEQKTISNTDFKSRSNALGVDQKLLRLRYGQFLGEENETQIGGSDEHEDHDGHENHAKEPEKFGDVQAMMDKYAHKHDIAEDATFFEPEIKAQLKAVLNEMWSAELKLRTFKPQEALPFEYKALRLLKDLQQKSRAYVAKTTVKTSALKPEKRLTGELDKIVEPKQSRNVETKERTKEELQIILALLNDGDGNKSFNQNEKALLKNAEKQIIIAAATHPNTYLNALKSIRKLNTQNTLSKTEILVISKALFQIIGNTEVKPSANQAGNTKSLATQYFNNLKKY